MTNLTKKSNPVSSSWFARLLENQVDRFLKKRMPGKSSHELNRLNLFILPSRAGGAFILLIAILFILGTNYQNNIILLISYLLVSLFLTSMMSSFNNVSGLILSLKNKSKGYQNQPTSVLLEIESLQERHNFVLQFSNAVQQDLTSVNKITKGVNHIHVPLVFRRRGHYNLGRLKILSQYPLGLFTCWTNIDFAQSALIFPSPKKLNINNHISKSTNDELGTIECDGIDELYQLNKYQQGEALSQVSWKHFARGQGMMSKQYKSFTNNSTTIVLSNMPSNNIETKLQYCCYLIQQAQLSNQAVNLDLGDKTVRYTESKQGSTVELSKHFDECLKALALYKRAEY